MFPWLSSPSLGSNSGSLWAPPTRISTGFLSMLILIFFSWGTPIPTASSSCPEWSACPPCSSHLSASDPHAWLPAQALHLMVPSISSSTCSLSQICSPFLSKGPSPGPSAQCMASTLPRGSQQPGDQTWPFHPQTTHHQSPGLVNFTFVCHSSPSSPHPSPFRPHYLCPRIWRASDACPSLRLAPPIFFSPCHQHRPSKRTKCTLDGLHNTSATLESCRTPFGWSLAEDKKVATPGGGVGMTVRSGGSPVQICKYSVLWSRWWLPGDVNRLTFIKHELNIWHVTICLWYVKK